MAQINDAPQIHRRKAGVRPVKKHNLRTDMTPMVDLGFLLIAFFVMTTEMSKPKNLKLNMPKDGPPTPIKNSTALTVILGKDNSVYYYQGGWEEALKNNQVFQTDLSTGKGIGKVIRDKRDWLEKAKISKEGKDELMLMIKPTDNTSYAQIIDMLDETIINKVTRYAIVKPEPGELLYIERKN